MKVDGGCHCGKIAYEAIIDADKVGMCHCTDCNKRAHSFCADCGAPVYSSAVGDDPPAYSLRVGCLTQRAQLRPTRQIWCDSALPWSTNLESIPALARQ